MLNSPVLFAGLQTLGYGMSENLPDAKIVWDPAPFLPPGFELLEKLGEGGNGLVYKVKQKTTERFLAFKFIRAAAADSGRSYETFQKEARVIAKLDHQNIVKVIQVGVCSDQTPYIVYEYLSGCTLASYLEGKHSLSPRALACIFTQLCSALAYAHSNNVIHRDIKPSNIMLYADSQSIFQVKLLDFGMAKDNMQSQQNQTITSGPKGSPAYMSPEQCKGEAVDHRTDIYSLSCVLYECLLGHPPFVADTNFGLLYKHINEAPSLPNSLLPANLNALLAKSLAKEPNKRPTDMQDFEQQLRSALKGLEQKNNGQARNKILRFAALLAVLVPTVLFLAYQYRLNTKSPHDLAGPQSWRQAQKKAERKGLPTWASPESQLTSLYENVFKAGPDSNDFTMLTEKVSGVIKTLESSTNQNPKKKGYLYEAYLIRSSCRSRKNQVVEFKRDIYSALELCKAKNGKFAPEAASCFIRIAELCSEQNDKTGMEVNARQACEIIEHAASAPAIIQLPEFDDFSTPSATRLQAYSLYAMAALGRKQYAQARMLAEKALAHKRVWWAAEMYWPSLMIIESYIDEGDRKAARACLKKMIDAAVQESHIDAFTAKMSFNTLKELGEKCNFLYHEEEYAKLALTRAIEVASSIDEPASDIANKVEQVKRELQALEAKSGKK